MAEAPRLLIDRTRTPLGELILVADGEGRLRAVGWADHEAHLLRRLRGHCDGRAFALVPRADPGGLTRALAAYFAGDLRAIDDLPVCTGGTPFQRAVWAALRRIPCGTTVSYGEIARRIGRPSAVRAVGQANNANPVGIVVPCHRVVAADGALAGYGGGVERKRWLLAHEGARG
ncbi:MAG TPA: methylated-DNA--[protein]-cysteine S-methyltransferase [Candidatus Binatia bacterium]|nr:methylated-DNA--[protein]-cysteine S-methyltransferase [Candidatus Binatia bacterium]